MGTLSSNYPNSNAVEAALNRANSAAHEITLLSEDVAELQTAVSGKASQSDLEALQATVEYKADADDLTALAATVSSKADAADLTALEAEVDTKADSSALTTAAANLQAQIDNLITPVTQDAEVQNARVGADGTSYQTLKGRLDAENNAINAEFVHVQTSTPIALTELNTYEGYLTSNGKGVVSGNTYVTYTFHNNTDKIINVLVNVIGTLSSYSIFRASIADHDPITGDVVEATPITITDVSVLTQSIPSGAYFCLCCKKQSVDTIEYAFTQISYAKTGISTLYNLPNLVLTEGQKGNLYNITYQDGLLQVIGNGIECNFSDLTFDNNHGLFELQNLQYKNDIIFGAENDYIGPIKLTDGDIIGAKHGGETTDSVSIITDSGKLDSGSVSTAAFTVYVTSHIPNVMSRISVYSFCGRKITTSSYITTTADNSFNRIWCCGILSCNDNIAKAWLSKGLLTESTSGNSDLLDKFQLICNKFTLTSNMLWVNSPIGIISQEFVVYASQNRKKFYNYNIYGNQEVASGTTFSSCNQLELN